MFEVLLLSKQKKLEGYNIQRRYTMKLTFSISRHRRLLTYAVIFGIALIFASVENANAQGRRAIAQDTFVKVDTFVPEGLPVAFEQSSLVRTIRLDLVLRFTAWNSKSERLSDLQFLVLIVGQNGDVKAGHGWRAGKGINGLSYSEMEVEIKFPVADTDRLVLTTYEAVGESQTFSVSATKVVSELTAKGLLKEVKTSKKFVKTVGANLAQTNNCAAALSAANATCTCGVKTFMCDPQTGSFSFTCFTKDESPSCPESSPDN